MYSKSTIHAHVNSLSHKEHKLTQDDVYRLDSSAKVIGDLKVIAVKVGRCHVSEVKGELVVMMRDVERVNCRR